MTGEVGKFPEWRQAVDDFVQLGASPGYIVTKQWLLEHFCIEYPALGTPEQIRKLDLKFLKYRTAMFDELMRDYKIQFAECDVDAQGYRVLEPREVMKFVKRKNTAELHRSIRKSGDRLAYTNLSELSPEELKAHAEMSVRITRKLQALNEVDRSAIAPVDLPKPHPRLHPEEADAL